MLPRSPLPPHAHKDEEPTMPANPGQVSPSEELQAIRSKLCHMIDAYDSQAEPFNTAMKHVDDAQCSLSEAIKVFADSAEVSRVTGGEGT